MYHMLTLQFKPIENVKASTIRVNIVLTEDNRTP